MARLGSGARGAAGGAGAGFTIGGPWGAAAGAGLGFLGGFFGGDDDPEGFSTDNPEHQFRNLLRLNAGNLRRDATGMKRTGQAVTTPAVNYLTDVLSSNPAAVMDATRQERGRVIDQYDTARRAIANFGPRGGGSTSTLAESRFQQAESLADITSTARRDAVSQAGELGVRLQALGLNADQLASADINTVIRAILAREGLGVEGQELGLKKGEATGQLIGQVLEGIFEKSEAA